MSVNIPETAVDSDFALAVYNIDEYGIYQIAEYSRTDGTLYMKSVLSNLIGVRQYKNITLSYFDLTGKKWLYDVKWELTYDINGIIVSRKKVM